MSGGHCSSGDGDGSGSGVGVGVGSGVGSGDGSGVGVGGHPQSNDADSPSVPVWSGGPPQMQYSGVQLCVSCHDPEPAGVGVGVVPSHRLGVQ